MKTIKERANLAAIEDTSKGRNRKDYFISAMADHESGFREGYIQGATEQKAIDIDNHWNWIKALAKITMDVDISAYEEMFKNKAMEE